jgi:hypothetical protein
MDISPTVLKIPSKLLVVFTPINAERNVAKMKLNKGKSRGDDTYFVFLSTAIFITHITNAVKIPICWILIDTAEDKAKISIPMNIILSKILTISMFIISV